MEIKYICPLWGFETVAFESFCEQVIEAGYDGVEMSLPWDEPNQGAERIELLKKYDLLFIAQHWETVEPDIDTHKKLFRQRLAGLAKHKPFLINTQTGLDWLSMEKNQAIIEVAKEVSAETGVRIIHETHRRKFGYSAAIMNQYLQADPELRITADFSHWCCVSESLLEDQQHLVAAAAERADHIHARVGYQEGPQVSDPRAPEWKDAVDTHLGFWDLIIDHQKQRGTEIFTIAPEFGPFPYMAQLPYTCQPIASQWDINIYMKNMLKERYQTRL